MKPPGSELFFFCGGFYYFNLIYEWCIWGFLVLLDSVLVTCVLLEICSFLLGYPICLQIITLIVLCNPFCFWDICCNVSFFISDVIYQNLLSFFLVQLNICWFCLFKKKVLLVCFFLLCFHSLLYFISDIYCFLPSVDFGFSLLCFF